VSPEMSAFTGGGANAWSIAAGLAGPIFEGGLLTAQYKVAYSSWLESKLEYQQTVLTAMGEVSDALTDRQKLAEVRLKQEYSVSAYAEAVDVSMKRYVAGKASYYEVLDAQTKLFPNESDLVNTRLAELLAVVDLYKALGGGWALMKDDAFLHNPTAPAGNSAAPATDEPRPDMLLAPPSDLNAKPVMLGPGTSAGPGSYYKPPTNNTMP